MHIITFCDRQGSERKLRLPQTSDNEIKLPEEDDGDSRAAGEGNEVDPASLLRAQIKQHDDEKKKHHDSAGIDEHLNDADEKRVERHKERGKSKEGNDQTECTGHR